MREVLTRWTATNSSESMVSVMNFEDGTPIEDVRSALALFWEDVSQFLTSGTGWEIETSGRVFDEANGQTQGLWTDTTEHSGNGGISGTEPVANAAMVLFQWRTGLYREGRELRGRTYVPGMSQLHAQGGEIAPSTRGTLATAAASLAANPAGLAIWSRPKDNLPGASAPVLLGSVWNEFAVLRSRRG